MYVSVLLRFCLGSRECSHHFVFCFFVFFFKQKTAYELRISDWSSDVCSSDLMANAEPSTQLSPRRAELASFERCYAVAVRNRLASGCIQFIVSTGEALRPFRVSSRPPEKGENLTTLVT